MPSCGNGASWLSNRQEEPKVSWLRHGASRTLTVNQSAMLSFPALEDVNSLHRTDFRDSRVLCALLKGVKRGKTLKYLAGAAALASAFVLVGMAAADMTGNVLTLYPAGGGA